MALDPEMISNWREVLDDFESDVWPMMQAFGYAKQAALQSYLLMRIAGAVETLAAIHIDSGDDGDEWKHL